MIWGVVGVGDRLCGILEFLSASIARTQEINTGTSLSLWTLVIVCDFVFIICLYLT